MDSRRFDALTRSLVAPNTRRGLLGTLAAVGAVLVGAHSVERANAQVSQTQCGNTFCAANPASLHGWLRLLHLRQWQLPLPPTRRMHRRRHLTTPHNHSATDNHPGADDDNHDHHERADDHDIHDNVDHPSSVDLHHQRPCLRVLL